MRVWKWVVLVSCLLVPLLGFLAFGGCGKEKSTGELIEDLKSSKEEDRIRAVRSLPVRPEEAAQIVPSLIDALKDRQADVRISAAIKLGVFGEQAREAIPALQAALHDRDARVRGAAETALSRIDPDAAPKKAPSRAGGK